MSRLVLGINSEHADASAVLVSESGILAAIAEERISRKKHDGSFPILAIREALRIAGASPSDITDIAVARDPYANLAAKIAFLAASPQKVLPRAMDRFGVHGRVASTAEKIADGLGTEAGPIKAKFHRVEHHLAHIASAFYGSPFERALGLSVDGAGDFASAMVANCEGTKIRIRRRTLFPHSLGVFYTSICQYIGFDRFGEEYKVMGLSAYGVNRYAHEMRELVTFDEKNGIRLNLEYFQHHRGEGRIETTSEGEITIPKLWSAKLESLLGPRRERHQPLDDRHHDIAASLQARFEDIYLAHIGSAVKRLEQGDVVMAGGSTLNSVGNGRLLTERIVNRAYFHPAASDDGTAAGAALLVLHERLGTPRIEPIRHAYFGSAYHDAEIEEAIVSSGFSFQKLGRDALISKAADAISQGKIVGWFQGREEWGPRALGNRSILCHPGFPDMKAILNSRIKNREPFRPFAPVVLAEKLSTCFHGEHEAPFMNVVYKVRSSWKERLSAITHEDGTGRVQTIRREDNPLYYDLIQAFEERTNIPVLLNTSFNENEPIVHTPEQAIDCFGRTKMDALGIGAYWLEKNE